MNDVWKKKFSKLVFYPTSWKRNMKTEFGTKLQEPPSLIIFTYSRIMATWPKSTFRFILKNSEKNAILFIYSQFVVAWNHGVCLSKNLFHPSFLFRVLNFDSHSSSQLPTFLKRKSQKEVIKRLPSDNRMSLAVIFHI